MDISFHYAQTHSAAGGRLRKFQRIPAGSKTDPLPVLLFYYFVIRPLKRF